MISAIVHVHEGISVIRAAIGAVIFDIIRFPLQLDYTRNL